MANKFDVFLMGMMFESFLSVQAEDIEDACQKTLATLGPEKFRNVGQIKDMGPITSYIVLGRKVGGPWWTVMEGAASMDKATAEAKRAEWETEIPVKWEFVIVEVPG